MEKLKTEENDHNYNLAKLQDFGLSKNEGMIYLYLLQYGKEAGGSKIALETALHRQYVYRALEKLLDLNLVEPVSHGKQKKYRAHSPAEIEKIARRRSNQASELATELQKISAIGNEQDFEIIQGVRAMQQYEIDRVTTVPEGSEQYFIGGASEGFFKMMAGEYEKEYAPIANKKKLKSYYIGFKEEHKVAVNAEIYERQHFEFRWMAKFPKGVVNMMILNDTVSFYTFVNPPILYVVKSQIVADSFKQFFMMLWDMGKEYKEGIV